MSLISQRQGFRRMRSTHSFWGFDPILTVAVGLLLFIGTLLVYAATRDWYAASGLDPEYYLKRHVINIVIGILLAWGTTVIDYRMLRAYTPIVWGLGVIGLTAVLIPGIGSDIADPDTTENAYSGTPIRPLLSFIAGGLKPLAQQLPEIKVPLLLFSSTQDHVVSPADSDFVVATYGGPVEQVKLERSYHVATQDFDKQLIFDGAVNFAFAVAES
jgi:pimeloyl-ACP methyl ester carboxylesterase